MWCLLALYIGVLPVLFLDRGFMPMFTQCMLVWSWSSISPTLFPHALMGHSVPCGWDTGQCNGDYNSSNLNEVLLCYFCLHTVYLMNKKLDNFVLRQELFIALYYYQYNTWRYFYYAWECPALLFTCTLYNNK